MVIRRVIYSIIYLIVALIGVFGMGAGIHFLALPLIPFAFFLINILKIKVPIFYEYIFLSFIIFAVGFGSMMGFYESIPSWDIILHTTAGVILAITPFYFIVIYKVKLPLIMKVLLIFMVSMGFAAVWEMVEFGLDTVLGIDSQKNETEGVLDTMHDICVHALGTGVFCIVYLVDGKFFNNKFYNFMEKQMYKRDVKDSVEQTEQIEG